MAAKKRYLIGYRERTTVPQELDAMMESWVAEEEGAKVLRKLKSGQRIVEMTEEQAARLAEKRADLVIEEDRELKMYWPMPGLPPRVSPETALTLNFQAADETTHKAISGVSIYCVGQEVTYKGVTDQKGAAVVKIFEPTLKRIIASPPDRYWSRMILSPAVENHGKINLTLKELPGGGQYGWGHLLLGLDRMGQKFAGRGVKVAVIDSGIAPHEDLKAAGGFNTLDGQDSNAWNVDEKGHGTHVSGIVAALRNQVGITGVAPEAEIYSLKVFPGGRFSDLIEAIEWSIDHSMDILSMSLGSPSPSGQIEQALAEANEKGITCIAAAGNEGGEVSFPAAYETVIAVSAIGQRGTFPDDSAHSLRAGKYSSPDGQLFFADFSNFGPQIDVCAPGVAILSSVPTGYASWDGTSMACPFITGLAALVLEAYPEIRTGDGWQPYYVREMIRRSARDIGLPAEMQGAGLPSAELALAEASSRQEAEAQVRASYREYMKALLERSRNFSKDLEQSLARLEAI